MVPPSWSCCYCSIDELGLGTPGAVESTASQWLSPEEHGELARFCSPQRRRSWVAGRIAAKQTLRRLRLVPAARAAEITITSRDDRGRGVVPTIRVASRKQPTSLSISHTERGVLVGVALSEEVRVGVDLAPADEYGPGFRHLWFSEQERALMRRGGGRFTPAVLWAAKEAVYKTLDDEVSFAPRQIEIQADRGRPMTCKVRGRELRSNCTIIDWCVDGNVACLAVRNVSHSDDAHESLQITRNATL